MKSNVKEPIIILDGAELSELVSEVKETVAINVDEKSVFSAADLWNIQRNMKTTQRFSRKKYLESYL
ncbi:hypothetical protein [Limnovirga soli]|jgi:hypothetical protein|uniref:Uncharacterized protein n=1 Tax=Limnovirga soli TaxID=2656915 RepID=A0A8J8FCY9_9BACT|nr:hypothetical protein [Limnovirga soli]NNV55781.1 hypothetical protein [Limnovirga soli]